MVKQGIRQAWTDIQGLDKAMTNIAVVTDMSVGDLWGKINEYMSIAQQYGVTTQGVYEVSQLYYQQGLSTDEVMAATTETLKMARIAGMDYKEAADAMTVAIRAFKMEMEDAQRVTDVYSKVAAVTASDSEELAIAMSKTASSAESVGSSFENTTAMLAVMIETTRESAQNLGSALKSIISRYGEMKVGLTVDSEGEDIDYNKVDTALKSIGISIKDAQGQFRDFDDVIFELSAKWDSLDKNTQRYIATIMAGNRQQSRFIALVDNWERLDEVANAAQNSEDAGLLQYAKTLDSLETKINNIKTSFQEFYMSIMNGPFFGAILTFINNLLQGLNQFSTLGSIINIVGIVRGLKSGLTALTNLFSNSFGGIISGWQATQKRWLNLAIKSGRERGAAERRAYEQGYNTGSAGPT
jgi:TP901 family phage tail tape measure protein